jgi:methylmalonyl-CoA mutase
LKHRQQLLGTQSLHTNALDEAIIPTDFSARIAKYTDLFTGRNKITKTVDPWAGSYYVERLTHELLTMRKLIEVEELGGMTKTIEAGFQNLELKKQLHESKHVLIADKILL